MTRVKVCCISSVEEARLAVALGAHAVGLVSEMPSGPGVIPEELIPQIAATVPAHVKTFLLTSRRSADGIAEQQRRCRTSTVQICDQPEIGSHERLRDTLPGIELIQVIHVASSQSVEDAVSTAPFVDALLLDSGNPTLQTKELGGTGRTHDWALSRQIVERSPVPVYLAGGLNAANVADAISEVLPYGVDLCSGVRSDGHLDEAKLTAFMAAVGI